MRGGQVRGTEVGHLADTPCSCRAFRSRAFRSRAARLRARRPNGRDALPGRVPWPGPLGGEDRNVPVPVPDLDTGGDRGTPRHEAHRRPLVQPGCTPFTGTSGSPGGAGNARNFGACADTAADPSVTASAACARSPQRNPNANNPPTSTTTRSARRPTAVRVTRSTATETAAGLFKRRDSPGRRYGDERHEPTAS